MLTASKPIDSQAASSYVKLAHEKGAKVVAYDRAIVAPDHGGALEMIEDDQTGLLFKAGDADDLECEDLLFAAD